MSCYEAKTIKEVIREIREDRMFLPSIQRSFVWTDEQITGLMDSIMRGYPIGTFLFWDIDKKMLNESGYSFYKFINTFHERDSFQNEEANRPYISTGCDTDRVIAVLDGQQRLTSLYLSLQGSIARKKKHARTENSESYIVKELYFNLHSNHENETDSENDENAIKYEFAFLTQDEATSTNDNDQLWFKLKDVLMYSINDFFDAASRLNITSDPLAFQNLTTLINRFTHEKSINYFNARAENNKFNSLDEITDIFVRINSGGTKLSKTDLLFSRIISIWEDARKEFQDLVSVLNNNNFKFTNDFVIKACLMVIDCDSRIKAESLNTKNITMIKERWQNIKDAIIDVKNFLFECGFIGENIESYNAILPIILYRYLYKKTALYNNKHLIQQYFVIVQVEKVFAKHTNATLNRLSKLIKNSPQFPDLKTLKIIEYDRLENLIHCWFDFEKGPSTYVILTLLYPSLQYNMISFDQDHMHPYAAFDKTNLDTIVNVLNPETGASMIGKEKLQYLKSQRNKLANLQLLEHIQNIRKGDKPLNRWLNETPENRNSVKYLPACSLNLEDFETFMTTRQQLMENELCRILGVKHCPEGAECP